MEFLNVYDEDQVM